MKKLIFIILFIPKIVWGEYDLASKYYKCVVKDYVKVEDSGEFKSTKKDLLAAIGSEFVVDKETGRMIGDLSNHNSYGSPMIIDPGSSEQIYKVVTIYKPIPTLDVLTVKEYEGENITFTFYSTFMFGIHSGTCTAN